MKTVLIGLSGGVDSALAASLLKKQGYKVIAAFMKNFSETKNPLTGECNWLDDYKMAQKVAAHLQIPLVKLDFEKEYMVHVIMPMFKSYKKGITPNPDVSCNTIIKFPLLWKAARKYRASYIATGHYARTRKTSRGIELLQGKDKNKDQSYFLYELTQNDLKHVLFPIGNLTKDQVRKQAKALGLPNYDKQSSRGVCFVGNISFKQFLEKRIKPKSGPVLDENNKIIGTHKGAYYYTIGERARPTSGIEISKGTLSQERFFIAKKNMQTNTITVVPENHPSLLKKTFYLKTVKWTSSRKKPKLKLKARLRHLGELTPCVLELKNNHWQFTLSEAKRGVAPGQSAVFYNKGQVICGGIISL